MNAPERPVYAEEDPEERIEELLQALPPELHTRWEKEAWGMEPAVAITRLEEVLAARSELMTHGLVRYSTEAEHDPVLHRGLERVISEFERSVGNPELFLGDGATAEVHRLTYDPRICIKTVHDEEMYRKGNTIYQEGDFMDRLNGFSVDGVRTPKFYFYHDTPTMKSLGMETIEGHSLSKIVEHAVEFPDIADISVDATTRALKNYITAMHDMKIYHGDLFERNIMIERETLLPRVIDFGKSRLAYFEDEVGNYETADFETLKKAMHSLERFLKGEKVDLTK